MARWVALLLCLTVASWAPAAAAQESAYPTRKDIDSISELWNGLYTKYRVSDRFFYYGEYHVRSREQLVGEMAQLYLRFGMTWRVDDDIELTGGAVTPLYFAPRVRVAQGDVARIVPQFRFWEQALMVQTIKRVRLYHQFRFEQRWRRDFAREAPFELTFRFRYKLAAYVPLNNTRMVEKTLFLVVYEEIFIQAGRTILFDHFEDNRIGGALGWILNRNLQTEMGYMWTFRHRGDPFAYQNRHIIRLNLRHNLDLRQVRRR